MPFPQKLLYLAPGTINNRNISQLYPHLFLSHFFIFHTPKIVSARNLFYFSNLNGLGFLPDSPSACLFGQQTKQKLPVFPAGTNSPQDLTEELPTPQSLHILSQIAGGLIVSAIFLLPYLIFLKNIVRTDILFWLLFFPTRPVPNRCITCCQRFTGV